MAGTREMTDATPGSPGGLRAFGRPGGFAPAVVIAGAVSVLALPSAVLAFSSRIDNAPSGFAAKEGLGTLMPGAIDPGLAMAITARPAGGDPLFRFTPAGLAARPDRSVTVAVRVDPVTANAIIIHASAPRPLVAIGPSTLRLANSAYSLGAASGAQSFMLPGDPHHLEAPDLRGFSLTDNNSAAGQPSRLAPAIQLSERSRAGREPRTLEGSGEQSVDVGGSYRLTHNIDVTAGLRYSEDRDRLKPLTDGKQDSQAVFVGTQFHF